MLMGESYKLTCIKSTETRKNKILWKYSKNVGMAHKGQKQEGMSR